MRAYARKLGGDEDLWGVTGLLHDSDYERWQSLKDHPYRGNEILAERGWNVRRWQARHHYFGGVSVVSRRGAAADPRRSGAASMF